MRVWSLLIEFVHMEVLHGEPAYGVGPLVELSLGFIASKLSDSNLEFSLKKML